MPFQLLEGIIHVSDECLQVQPQGVVLCESRVRDRADRWIVHRQNPHLERISIRLSHRRVPHLHDQMVLPREVRIPPQQDFSVPPVREGLDHLGRESPSKRRDRVVYIGHETLHRDLQRLVLRDDQILHLQQKGRIVYRKDRNYHRVSDRRGFPVRSREEQCVLPEPVYGRGGNPDVGRRIYPNLYLVLALHRPDQGGIIHILSPWVEGKRRRIVLEDTVVRNLFDPDRRIVHWRNLQDQRFRVAFHEPWVRSVEIDCIRP